MLVVLRWLGRHLSQSPQAGVVLDFRKWERDWVLSMWEEQGDSAQILLEKAGQSETARKK